MACYNWKHYNDFSKNPWCPSAKVELGTQCMVDDQVGAHLKSKADRNASDQGWLMWPARLNTMLDALQKK